MVPVDYRAQLREMLLDGCFTGLDERLVAERDAVSVLAAVGFANAELPHGEAQEINPNLSLMGLEGVADSGLARAQLQSHACQEAFHCGACCLNAGIVRTQNDEVE
jgi:hypothetical protein